MIHTLPPTLPGDWLAAVRHPSPGHGIYQSYTVLHYSESGSGELVVHCACWNDEGLIMPGIPGWDYGHGDYCGPPSRFNTPQEYEDYGLQVFHRRLSRQGFGFQADDKRPTFSED